MEWWKILSLVIAAFYIVFGVIVFFASDDVEDEEIAGVIVIPLLSLGLIWYGDELGEGLIGAKFGLVTKTSPGWAVAFMGWLFLLAPIVIPAVSWLF